MKRQIFIATLAILLTSGAPAKQKPKTAAEAEAQAAELVAELERVTGMPEFQMVPMRDGTKLWTAVWKPKGVRGPLPTILVRTPYTPDTEVAILREITPELAKNGYAVVIQNERGSFLSQGRFRISGWRARGRVRHS